MESQGKHIGRHTHKHTHKQSLHWLAFCAVCVCVCVFEFSFMCVSISKLHALTIHSVLV